MRHALWAAIGLSVVSLSGCGSDSEDKFSETSSSASTTGAGGSGGAGEGGAGVGGAATTSSTSSSSGEGGAGGGGTCGPREDACTQCLARSCEDIYCTCYASAECGALIVCLDACSEGDADCGQSCLTDHESGISDALLLGDCGATSCERECPGSAELSGCQRCLATNCSTQMNTCFANAECSALVACADACPPGNMVCQQGCILQHGGGVTDARAVLMCSQASCPDDCN